MCTSRCSGRSFLVLEYAFAGCCFEPTRCRKWPELRQRKSVWVSLHQAALARRSTVPGEGSIDWRYFGAAVG